MQTDPGVVSANGNISKTPGGLHRDEQDYEQLRWNGRESHGSVYGPYLQPAPLLFTAEGHNLWMGDMYRGRSLFIVAGGPSLADMDLSSLAAPGIMAMGLNNAPRVFRPNMWTCVDSPSSFLRSVWLDPCILKFVPMCSADKAIFDNDSIIEKDGRGGIIRGVDGKAILHDDKARFLQRPNGSALRVRDCPGMIYYRRNEHFRADQFLWEDTVNWGNSGDLGSGRSVFLVAMRLAFILGFRRVYLLGVDFNMTAEKGYAFPQDRSVGSIRGNNSTYAQNMERLALLKPFMDKEGFKVFNCTPGSALKVFPAVPLEQAIQEVRTEFEAGGSPIDFYNENTEGLYDREDRRKKADAAKLEAALAKTKADDKAKIKAAGLKATAGVAALKPIRLKADVAKENEEPIEHKIYPEEAKVDAQSRLNAARQILNERKEATKTAMKLEPIGGDDQAIERWTAELSVATEAEEDARTMMRTIEDEKRWKHGEDIRWGLWDPTHERPLDQRVEA